MLLARRKLIGATVLVGLAGCTGSDSNSDDEDAEDPVEVGDSGGGVSFVRHHFEDHDEIGPRLFVTIRNSRDAAFELGELECRVYDDDDTLVAGEYRTISMSANTTEEFDLTFDMGLEPEDLRQATHYEIIADIPYKNGVTDETQEEFNRPIRFAESTDEE
ncbi:hypothetical protein A6E15_08185 [Natrinema saccharevitans]|uniref:Intracellular proteinase inhibitor BsuPI domain-containing protein n=1 Tax=Natrinema saccharevitans TaxID=301967 RepID=A0A1S8AWC7_9EURY|nr:hypothetical protein [Natrinema saccharevitans]OLZ40972.1 hypothetical protein A6E15_08185 [Natrinema saccharevitans]